MTQPPPARTALLEPTAELIRHAQRGDRTAQGAIAQMYYPRMRRWALLETGSPELADEAVQEALVRWIRLGHTFQVGTRFTPWMRQLVRNCSRDVRKPKGVLRFLPWARRQAPVERQLDLSRAAGRALNALVGLTDRQREVVDLVDLQGLSAVEAAEHLAIQPATARVHLHEGRKRLSAALDSADHDLLEEG